ncbi:MAG: hypothetical protein AAGA02_15525 [Bacteroidota bacterium]
MQLLLNTQKEQILERIEAIFAQEEDFWDELNAEDQAAINEGLSQLDEGQYVSHQSVRKDIKNRFNF